MFKLFNYALIIVCFLCSSHLSAEVEILKTREWTEDGKTPTGTIWRGFQVWKNDVVIMPDGSYIEVDPRFPVVAPAKRGNELIELDPKYQSQMKNKVKQEAARINPAKRFVATPNPPQGWQATDFDDGDWLRDAFPQRALYGLTKYRCLRGTFTVTDSKKAGELQLRFRYRGGAVVYLNGKEIARGHLPKGGITPDTMATPYTKDAFIDAHGELIDQGIHFHGGHPNKGAHIKNALYTCRKEAGLTHWENRGCSIAHDHAHKFWFHSKDADVVKKYQSRTRVLEITIKPDQLQKGLNVLALAVHRAPALPVMFEKGVQFGQRDLIQRWWDRCEIEDIRLIGKSSEGIVPNIRQPQAMQVFNHPANVSLSPAFYADPNDTLRPVRIHGLRNGSYAGQLVVSGSTIKDLSVSVTDLKGASTISKNNIQIRYPEVCDTTSVRGKRKGFTGTYFDNLEPAPGNLIKQVPGKYNRTFKAMQPIWFNITIPKDAAPGKYLAHVTIKADGLNSEAVLELHVHGTWVLPDPQDSSIVGAFLESPDAIAGYYGLEMWSSEHWEMIEKCFKELGELGNKAVFIPLIGKTHLGNEHSMIHYIKQKDGSFKIDTSIAEKYLDIAIKHCGDLDIICLWTSHGYTVKDKNPRISLKDPKTGKLTEYRPPIWGDPKSLTFWPPVIDACKKMIAKRKQSTDAIMFGLLSDSPGPDFPDIHACSPDTNWITSTHLAYRSYKGKDKAGKKIKGTDFLGAWSHMFNEFFSEGHDWMGDIDGPRLYKWQEDVKTPRLRLASSRSRTQLFVNDYMADLNRLSIFSEALMTRARGDSINGYGLWGANFWNAEMHLYDNNKRTGIDQNTFRWAVAPGKNGPVPTCRSQNIKMGLQDYEVRRYVEDAVQNAASHKLSKKLVERCKNICDERSKIITFISRYRYNSPQGRMPKAILIPDLKAWSKNTIALYEIAGEINDTIGKGK